MSFTKSQRQAAMIYQDIKPDDDVEADHIIPKSKGGKDDVTNIKFIASVANRRKSNHMIELRDWQKNFIRSWSDTRKKNFLLVAIPGGGKTVAALAAAKDFLEDNDRRIMIVVPTDNLRRQWEVEASKAGIHLQTTDFGTDFRKGFIGGVTTYSTLSRQATLFRMVCRRPTLVIFDEPHHCGRKLPWATSAELAFENAERRLLLSGTPFRTDGKRISYVDYDVDGFCKPDFRYDYPDALKDGVVRILSFDYSRGYYEVGVGDKRERLEVSSEIPEAEAKARLSPLLDPSGGFVTEQIRRSHEKLKAIRESVKDAAAMAVCINIDHAKEVAAVIRRETGCEPSIICSDDEVSNDNVDRFRDCSKEWLVSIKQVSEGTDIKRLQVLCYLTNVTAPMSFRQLVGRVSRIRFAGDDTASEEKQEQDMLAYVFLPSDTRLIDNAKNIEEAQDFAITDDEEEEKQERLFDDADERETWDDERYFLGSTHEGTELQFVLGKEHGGRSFTRDECEVINDIVSFGVSIEKAIAIFDSGYRRDGFIRKPKETELKFGKTKQDEVKSFSKIVAGKVVKLAGKMKMTPKEAHIFLMRNYGFKRQNEMGMEELQKKMEVTISLLQNQRSNQ